MHFSFILSPMDKVEHIFVGEVIEIMTFETLLVELYKKDFDVIQNPLVSFHQEKAEVIFCVLKTFQDSIDQSRRALALNMSETMLQKEHPEHQLLIKPYITILIIGSLFESTFATGIQKFNIGLHSRCSIVTESTIRNIVESSKTLNPFLGYFATHPLLKNQLKNIVKIFTNNYPEQKHVLIHSLCNFLRDDYFLLKEISNYIN